MKLTRPIVFFDLETTGVKIGIDRIVEMSLCKIHTDGKQDIFTLLVNPEMPIPKEASDVHGITDDKVRGKHPFRDIAPRLLKLIEGCDLGGFNSNKFDVPFLFAEFTRVGLQWDYTKHDFVDAYSIYVSHERRDLTSAVKYYLNRDHEGAHGAEADIKATVEVFMKQVEMYDDLPDSISEIAKSQMKEGAIRVDLSGKFYRATKDGPILLAFGKHKDMPAKDHIGFLLWMMGVPDMPLDSKMIAQQIRNEIIGIDKSKPITQRPNVRANSLA